MANQTIVIYNNVSGKIAGFAEPETASDSFMTTTIRHITLLILTFLGLTVYAQKHSIETRNDFKKYYDQFKGSVLR